MLNLSFIKVKKARMKNILYRQAKKARLTTKYILINIFMDN